jgi:hypothetical protein
MRFRFLQFVILGLSLLAVEMNACQGQDSNAFVSDAEIAAAMSTLKTNPVLVTGPMENYGATNPIQVEKYKHIYDAQINAIAVLGRAKAPGTAPVLISYLNYHTDGYQSYVMHMNDVSGQNTNVILIVWPALNALVAIPDSGQVLADYALDKKNPIKQRINALEALKIVDLQLFKSVASKMNTEFPNQDFIGRYIRWTEGDDQRYLGTFILDAHLK